MEWLEFDFIDRSVRVNIAGPVMSEQGIVELLRSKVDEWRAEPDSPNDSAGPSSSDDSTDG